MFRWQQCPARQGTRPTQPQTAPAISCPPPCSWLEAPLHFSSSCTPPLENGIFGLTLPSSARNVLRLQGELLDCRLPSVVFGLRVELTSGKLRPTCYPRSDRMS